MVKSYLIGLNIVGVFLLSILYTQDKVKFEYGPIVGVNIGETKTVTLSIDKGIAIGAGKLILGFSKAQGIEATILNAGGAVPEREEGNLILRWDNLPAEPIINISFEITGRLYGNQIIDGEFSYVDGTRKTIHIPEKVIHVYPEKTPQLECHRDISKTSEHDYDISLEINPGDMKGFGGIKENIPEGFAANILDAGDATAKIDPLKNQIVFTWLQLPSNGQNISVKYQLKEITPNNPIYDIDGFFWAEYMIVDNQSVEYYIPTTNKHGFEKEKPKLETPPANGDVTFKVQIMAAHKVVGKQYFKSMHKFSADFTVENHEGWQKYTIGHFPEYQFARDKREELRKNTNLPKPFVTAYNKTDRITVQEALILANQKWLK